METYELSGLPHDWTHIRINLPEVECTKLCSPGSFDNHNNGTSEGHVHCNTIGF